MAVLPARTIEIEFDAGTWTDVSADFVAAGSQRGRNRESGAFETGSLVVKLRNDGRKYDPDNTAGPYYGKLRPNRRIRWRSTYNAVTYPQFQGYIDRITQNYEGPNAGSATIEASDLFKLLNRVQLPVSVYAVEVAADNPALWYRLDEPVGSLTAVNSGTLGRGYDGTWTPSFPWAIPVAGPGILGAESLIVRDPGSAVQQDGTHWPELNIPAGFAVDQTQPFAIEAWFNTATPAAGSNNFLFIEQTVGGQVAGAAGGIYLQVADDMRPGLIMWNDAGTPYGVRTSSALSPGVTYHIVARHDSDRTMHMFVNGVDVTAADLGVPGTTTGTFTKVAGTSVRAPYWLTTEAIIDEIAIYQGSVLSSSRIAAHNSAGRTPWTGDTPAARLGRILDLAAVPAADRTIDTGTVTLQATDLGGDPLSYAQKIEETEIGRLFVTADGKIRFLARDTAVTGTYLTSKATLVDADSGAGIGYRLPAAEVSESFVVTRATVSREGSVAITYSDAAAKAEFGWLDETHDGLLHDSDTYSAAYAQWIVNTHASPASRIGRVTLELTGDPAAMYPAILALELGDRVTYKRKPQNTGSVWSTDMRVEAIAHETGGASWRATLQLSPFNPAVSGYPVGVWDTGLWDQAVWGI